ncbi:hypothetical protein C2845_PM09G23180 [Panicum miliaceum]|uniref:DUF4220 domain-containing protein n=1 Tax=Panicum miliaceum TaxID=4540 RepID=A0A3L6S2E6_PANMI|nr:hypothetical protein C2845_PM09G23180 [Panicum miliaceum]
MAQLQQLGGESQNTPPALVVMGEDNVQVEKQPHGYSFKEMPPNNGDTRRLMMTLDKVSHQLDEDIGMFQSSTARRPEASDDKINKHKDLCFSFALFKLLRCRFAKYTTLEAGFVNTMSLYLVLVVLVLAETRDIVSFLCSNWTKISLIYHYHTNQASWQRSRIMKKCIGSVLKLRRCKLLNTWDNKMKQCSIPVPHPRKITRILLHVRRFLCLSDRKTKIKIPTAVKTAIFDALKDEESLVVCEEEGSLKHIMPPSSPTPCSGAGDISGKRPAYTILAWHVATSIYEVGHHSQQASHPEADLQGHKIAATHLSRYCAYLVAYCPDLLPDDARWCESLYCDVKKGYASHVLSETPAGGAVEYQRLVQLLSEDTNHEVLKDGARLGKKLVESETGWEALSPSGRR